MSGRGTIGSAAGAADRAGNSDALEHLARVGLIAYGVVHLLLAWLALQLAWGGGGQEASQSGAMATLSESPVGKPLLWVIALGMIALAAWQAAEILRWRGGLSASGDARKKAIKKIVKSVATSRIAPRTTRSSLSCAIGGSWKCSPRTTPTSADSEWLSCTKSAAMPAAANALRL